MPGAPGFHPSQQTEVIVAAAGTINGVGCVSPDVLTSTGMAKALHWLMSQPLPASLETATWPNNSPTHVSAQSAHLVRTKWIVVGLQSCFSLVGQSATLDGQVILPSLGALAWKQAPSSQDLAAVSPCRE